MQFNNKLIYILKRRRKEFSDFILKPITRNYTGIPFVDLYQKTTGKIVSQYFLDKLRKKHPTLETLSEDQLQCTLSILEKFGITAEDACHDPHVFTMNPITMDNYGEILKECAFIKVLPKYIIRYHTLVRSKTIAWLKKENLVKQDLILEDVLYNCFQEWPGKEKTSHRLPDSDTNIVTVRMSVLQKFLNWKLGVTEEEFSKYCRNYLPLRHKPMVDIQEALYLAENHIKFDIAGIKRNGFLISSDPVNTKLILDKVDYLASVDIKEAIRIEPAILKNNYNAILQIRSLLEEYEISQEAQRRCFKVYCMRPDTVKERLEELRNLKEYQVLKSNPRVLSMVVHKRKMMNRLDKIQAAKKQCFSLNHLVSSSKVFNHYINSFGNKVCGRDLAILISSSLRLRSGSAPEPKQVLQRLKKHKFWLHAALNVIDENMQHLKNRFRDDVIFNNCQLLLYPVAEIENYIEFILSKRKGETTTLHHDIQLDTTYNNLKYSALNDDQILSLVLYEIEKKYHFSGDGIWAHQDGVKIEAHAS